MTFQAPIRAPATRRDGWTAARTVQFLDHLAADGSVRAACGRVGMSREAAYKLRRRDPLFARAWNAALLLARDVSAEVLEDRAIHGIEEEVWYRGELVGTRRKYDSRLLLAHMARLDRVAVAEGTSEDAGRFDELLAAIGGEPAPDGHECDEQGLPADRETFVDIAVDRAEVAFDEAWAAAHPASEESEDEEADPDAVRAGHDREVAEYRAYQDALIEEKWRAGLAAGAQWDEWREGTHRTVDRWLAEQIADAGTVSTVSTSPENQGPDAQA